MRKPRNARSVRQRGPAKNRDPVGDYASDAWSLAKRTAAGLNEIRKLINVEQKFSESTSSTTFDRSGTVVYLSGISQGDDVVTREGNSIKVQTLRFSYFIKHNSATTSGSCSRVLIVRDMQNQGASITANEVMETVGTGQAPLAFRDFVNGPLQNKRFAVVYDETVVSDPYHPMVHEQFTTNHDVHVYYRGTTSAVASAGQGSYFLVLLSSDSGLNLPEIQYAFRLEFTDN